MDWTDLDRHARLPRSSGGNRQPFLSLPGTQINCQIWAGDPGFAPPADAQLSDALEFILEP
ncbi:MAG TPA: hypothetical protein VK843_14240 [Planctomycetota bacterium]|nr:hypothetical protein [Planctomycetota bacterium]